MSKLKLGEWAWSRSYNRPFKVSEVLDETYVEQGKDGKVYHSMVNVDRYDDWEWGT